MSPVQKPERVRGSANPLEVKALPRPGDRRRMMGRRGCSTKKMLKNDERTHYVYENKGNMDKMPGEKSDIYVRMTCF